MVVRGAGHGPRRPLHPAPRRAWPGTGGLAASKDAGLRGRPAAGVGRAMPAALLTPERPVGLEEAVFAPTGRLGAETGVEAAGAGGCERLPCRTVPSSCPGPALPAPRSSEAPGPAPSRFSGRGCAARRLRRRREPARIDV